VLLAFSATFALSGWLFFPTGFPILALGLLMVFGCAVAWGLEVI
jgi:hypothetical protein